MNRNRHLFALAVLVLAASLGAPQAEAQSGSVEVAVQANLIPAFPVTAIYPVSFGSVTISDTSGTVVLNEQTGDVSNSGGALQVDSRTTRRGLIRFVPPTDGVVSILAGSPFILLKDTNNDTSAGVRFAPAMEVTSTDVQGGVADEVHIGGILSFGNNTAPDVYRGTITITVAYT